MTVGEGGEGASAVAVVDVEAGGRGGADVDGGGGGGGVAGERGRRRRRRMTAASMVQREGEDADAMAKWRGMVGKANNVIEGDMEMNGRGCHAEAHYIYSHVHMCSLVFTIFGQKRPPSL